MILVLFKLTENTIELQMGLITGNRVKIHAPVSTSDALCIDVGCIDQCYVDSV